MIALTPVIWDSIYTGALSCIQTNTTPLSVDCNGNECGHSDQYTIIDEQNTTVLTLPFPTWMTLVHHPLDSGSDAIKAWNSSLNVNYTLARNTNYTINYDTGLVNFTSIKNGTGMRSFTNYTYTVITVGSCCSECVTGTSKTLLMLIPFIYVGLVIISFIVIGWAKFKEW